MKKLPSISILFVSLLIYNSVVYAQEDGWTTFYAEKIAFQIDLPDNWNPVLVEEKGFMGIYSAAGNASLENEENTRGVVLLSSVYKPKMGVKGINAPIEKDIKWSQNYQTKQAKKANDSEFKLLDSEIQKESHIEKASIGWHDYIETSEYESGESYILRKRNVYIFFHSTPRYRINLIFFSKVDNWDDAQKTFQKILNSFDRYKP